jgi:hypothetical protein
MSAVMTAVPPSASRTEALSIRRVTIRTLPLMP